MLNTTLKSQTPLQLPTVEQLNQSAQKENCLRAREHRGYSLFRIGSEFVYKRYHFPLEQSLGKKQREWENEHAVMRYLVDMKGVPHSYGYISEQTEQEQRYHVLRQFIEGEQVRKLLHEEVIWLGEFFAKLHAKLVTTNDPQLKNLVRDPNNKLHFIDFGKATLFERRTMGYYWKVGKELFDVMRCALHWHQPDWKAFFASYKQYSKLNTAEWALILCSYHLFYPYRVYRNLIRHRDLRT